MAIFDKTGAISKIRRLLRKGWEKGIGFMRWCVWVTIFSAGFLVGPVFAQEEGTHPEHQFFIKGFFAMPSLSMSVDGGQIDLTRFDPNRLWSTGVGFIKENFAGSVSVKTGEPVDDPDLYGETRYFDLQLQVYGKQMGIDVFLQSYQGYFMEDCSTRPDLKVEHAGAIFYYISNPRWSIRGAFNPPGRQERSAGSWFLSGGLNIYAVDSDGPFMEGLNPPIEGGRFYMASVAPGYGYTWVKGPWFISPAFCFGGGPMYADYSVSTGYDAPDPEWVMALKLGIKLGTGYVADSWQIGIRALADSSYASLDDVELQWLAQTVELYLLRRF